MHPQVESTPAHETLSIVKIEMNPCTRAAIVASYRISSLKLSGN
jgi:hypothetical protein